MKTPHLPDAHDVRQAAERIRPYAHRTPVLTSQAINVISGASCFFKCENFQKVGAFKFRGACNTVFSLSDDEAARGVLTHSSGNHGAAVALAARLRGIRAFVVMPDNAPAIKRAAVAGYGAEITTCGSNPQDRAEVGAQVLQKTGATFIHPSNEFLVIAGQGTAALELCQDVPELDIVLTPVGGGGLLSGTALAVSATSPKTVVMAGEPTNADDAYRSLQAGKIIPSENPQTIADGLRTSLGNLTFPLIQRHVQEIITVNEDIIVTAMRHLWERMKIVIEPSSAVAFGAILSSPDTFSGKRVGLILSGGNVDLNHLPF